MNGPSLALTTEASVTVTLDVQTLAQLLEELWRAQHTGGVVLHFSQGHAVSWHFLAKPEAMRFQERRKTDRRKGPPRGDDRRQHAR